MTAVKQANPYSDQLHGDLYDRERREMLGLGWGCCGRQWGGDKEREGERHRSRGKSNRRGDKQSDREK